METATHTHKPIRSWSKGYTYRGISITNLGKNGFSYIVTHYYAGLKGNNWLHGGRSTLKLAAAQIDQYFEDGFVKVGGGLYSPEAFAHMESVKK